MSTNNLQALIKTSNDSIVINQTAEDHLIGSIEDFRQYNGRYPNTVIFSEELAQYYFDRYVQGKTVKVKYKGKSMEFIVNIRFRAAKLFMK